MMRVPTQTDSLADWLDYQLAMHPTEIDMGLARVRQVAERLGLLELAPAKVITVGGTNGKGTTCAMLEAILCDAGKRVGVFSSPHLVHYNERIRIEGQDASDTDIIAAFTLIEQARGDISLTFFEFATLTGLQLFKQAKLDVIILEVGLGGRLDATNIIDADVAVVTSVDLDHQEYLGNTRELVGFEKAGIFKAGKPAVIGEPNLPVTVCEVAAAVGAPLNRVGYEFGYQAGKESWRFSSAHWQLNDLPLPSLPLPNAATAVAALECLYPDLPRESVYHGLAIATLAGRFEIVACQPLTILDVAHNPHAARYLASQLDAFAGRRILALCGMLKDKDIHSVMQIMMPVVSHWYLTPLPTERSASLDEMKSVMPAVACYQGFESLGSAWHAIKTDAQADDVVIVFGSFYTVSGVKSFIDGE
ncbi:MAG: bifunctional tetrahydrofolate synthase/dihydrofolate synthase [Shewanella sp.]|nr:bifunctional tetrahydrofolate synthase/dihydrofolate synthase [Shewanella sp.]MCF1431918.1 bifunctional tetrahydrofolate synthase/dihydrofolate synthase [Shewanella sp.]MCF1438967.1 bifunctional tetrahydrofolate synthase/dihydrofolate synthase [Shewanella sp.]MCF1459125.1 bifunctional tetrahydrofolate synthase/dihydrofolate synthase [Shewanella sp.]